MNRDSIIGFIIIAAILIGYSVWMTPSQEEMEARQRKIDSISMVRQQQQLLDSVRMAAEIKRIEQEVSTEPANVQNSAASEQPDNLGKLKERFGAFAVSAEGSDSSWVVENDVFELTFNARGGAINKVVLKDYQTWDSLPLVIFDPNNNDFNLSFFSSNRNINTSELYFRPYLNGFPYDGSQTLNASNSDSLRFSMRLLADNGMGQADPERYISYDYVIRPDEYLLNFDVNIMGGMDGIIASNTSFLSLNWQADLLQQERSVDKFNGSTIYYKHLNDDVDYLSETDDDEEVIRTKVKWVSFKQRFFSLPVLIAREFF